MAMSVQVSVVVPIYNGQRTLEQTLQSILAQSFPAMELLLVNDGSTDGSFKVLEPFLTDERVRYFEQPNRGVAAARNHGIREARGEWIAFCDQDDLWLPEKLSRQARLTANPGVGLIYSWAEIAHRAADGTATPLGQVNQRRFRGNCVQPIFSRNFIVSCTVLARRSAIEEAGLFDEDRALHGVDDWHLWLRMAPLTEFDVVEEVLAYHVDHGDNYSSNEVQMLEAEQACLAKIRRFALEIGVPQDDLEHAQFSSLAHYARNLFFTREYRAAARCWWRAWRIRPSAVQALLYAGALSLVPGRGITAVREGARWVRRRT